MPLNKTKGNMFSFVTHTFNTVKGRCPHDCSYCYMKRFKQAKTRFDAKELKTDLGEDNFIFVGSSCDMFAGAISGEWILKTLFRCREFNNQYLFQSKNPERFSDFRLFFPEDTYLGTTIETNCRYKEMGKAPHPEQRAIAMADISMKFKTMVTVEPIMDFDVDELSELIQRCNPGWVNIGADSKGHNLPEPSAMKILDLIDRLEKNDITVKLKDNLRRLMECL